MAAATNWCFGYNEIFAGEFELEEVESFQRHNLSTQMITEALPAVGAQYTVQSQNVAVVLGIGYHGTRILVPNSKEV